MSQDVIIRSTYTLGRYLMTGGAVFLIDISIFFALVNLAGVDPARAQFIARVSGAIAGFFGHRHFTFLHDLESARYSIIAQGGGYLFVGFAMLLATPFIVVFFLDVTDGELVLAKMLTEVVSVVVVYLSLRCIFQAKRR